MKRTEQLADPRIRAVYNTWRGMIQRCENPRHEGYARYGGRGVSICPQWRASFDCFLAWALENGHKSGLSIDRRDNDGNYTPANCRWATLKQQARNGSLSDERNLLVTYRGRQMSLSELSRLVRINYTTLRRRYRAGERGELLWRTPQAYKQLYGFARAESGNGKAKLSAEHVEAIRASAEPGVKLAARFHVSEAAVSMIRRGKRRA